MEVGPIIIDRDYPLLKSWWEERKFPAANPKFLPPNGAIVKVEGKEVCAGFLFRTDANTAIFGNLVSDPKADSKVRNDALNMLIETLSDLAAHYGFEMVCCSTNLERLMTRFEKLGFTKTDENVSNFGRLY